LSDYQIKDPAVINNNALNKACAEKPDLVGGYEVHSYKTYCY